MTDPAAAKYRSIDWPALVDKLGGDETLASTLLDIAQRSSAAMPADLRGAADPANFDTISRLAHKLKGTCGDICAHALREQAAATELAARASAPDAASRARDLADTLDAFLHELQAAAS
jgi:HPt (histidine-containing phosphotransfer) domain-containing protein